MGPLSPPATGAVYFDANAFIYGVEKIEPYASVLTSFWSSANSGRIEIVSSELSLLETLVKPLRERDSVAEQTYRALYFESVEVRLIPISVGILERAAQIRAETGLRTPDAIHVATALDVGAALFVTNDPAVTRVTALRFGLLSDK